MSNYMDSIDLTWEQQQKVDKCTDLYMIGRLDFSRNATRVDTNGNVQFFVEPLCDDPEIIIDTNIAIDTSPDYVGFDYKQNRSQLPLTYNPDSFNVTEKQDQLEEHLKDKLIIFHPTYQKSRQNGKWFKNFIMTKLVPDDELYDRFVAVPRSQMDVAKFEDTLKKGEYFEIAGYDGEINPVPEIILCGPYAYKLNIESYENDVPLLEFNQNVQTRWKCSSFDKIEKIEFGVLGEYKNCIIPASDNICFIEDSLRNAIIRSSQTVPFEEVRKSQLAQEKSQKESLEKRPVDDIDNGSPIEAELTNKEIEDSEEIQFIDALQQLTLDNGLQYKKNDLINFHISVKTNPLTILAGMSGTGKSRLAMNYAKMLDLSEDNGTLLFMPISPSYTEPSDVLGYLNSMNGLYVPSESGLVQFLIHAQNNLDQMHMVIFDEMNLSQVEYWFSPFISILEKDKGDRLLKLYDPDARCINEKVYPSSIRVGQNIIFVGTVNIDDTTKDFSDRLLDRTFVINLGMVSFADFLNDYLKQKAVIEKNDVMRFKCKTVGQFISWCHGDDRDYMSAFVDHPQEIDFFDELNMLIKQYIPDGGISHRVMKNIGNYILNVPAKSNALVIPRTIVLDTVVNQTVMTKIRGTETQLQRLIGILDENGDLKDSEFLSLLNKYSSISGFESVKNNLRRKAKELDINGYTN